VADVCRYVPMYLHTRVARFSLVQYTNMEKYTKRPHNIKIYVYMTYLYQITTKMPNGREIYKTDINFQRISKYWETEIFGMKIDHLATLLRTTRLC
jgi:hypothetical protein